MTSAKLRKLFASPEFKGDLEELSSYLSSIAPETPIVFCLAKQLWKQRYTFQVEAKRQDLVINGKRIEFKSSYDSGIERLEMELDRLGSQSLAEEWKAKKAIKKSMGWSIMKLFQKPNNP